MRSYSSKSLSLNCVAFRVSTGAVTSTHSPCNRRILLSFASGERSHAKLSPSCAENKSNTVWPFARCCSPNASNKLDLPEPRTPKVKVVLGLFKLMFSRPLTHHTFKTITLLFSWCTTLEFHCREPELSAGLFYPATCSL